MKLEFNRVLMKRAIHTRNIDVIQETAEFLGNFKVLAALRSIKRERVSSEQLKSLKTVIIRGVSK